MKYHPSYLEAQRELLLHAFEVGCETIPLSQCGGRILAQDVIAIDDVPAFDRSPYDGYALRSEDTVNATKETPKTLEVIEQIAAQEVAHRKIGKNQAIRLMTGAMLPEGADTIIMYEKTQFTDKTVTIFEPLKKNNNIIFKGEDVKKGSVLAKKGTLIDAGLAGTLASQGIDYPLVYKIPKVGIISTGSEIVEVDVEPKLGQIRNSNRHMLETLVKQLGYEPIYLGCVKDDINETCELIEASISKCDVMITTGGVSVGDFDFIPVVLEKIGADILFRGVDMKPGMACAYATYQNKLICGLSGNPASSLTNFYAVAYPAFKKISGISKYEIEEITITLLNDFKKKSLKTRFLRGKMKIVDGMIGMELPKDQGNVVLSSTIGCNMIAIVPAGTQGLKQGTKLKGFTL